MGAHAPGVHEHAFGVDASGRILDSLAVAEFYDSSLQNAETGIEPKNAAVVFGHAVAAFLD
jgi:hypothetical protein